MKFSIGKYNRRISSMILICYLIVLTLGIFHHHKYDLNEPKAYTTESTQSVLFNIDVNSGFDCIVQHNISQLHNFNLVFEVSLNYFVHKVESFSTLDSTKLISSTFSSPNTLRAPPSYS
jgi:hypothetical protein